MVFADVVAFMKALPEILKILGEISLSLKQLRTDAIKKEIDSIKKDVDNQIQNIILSRNDEERKKAIAALALALSK